MTPLPADSYTARRLEHATPKHLHLTTRRTFIGPIPEGWLKSHRREWYKSYVGSGNRAPTFTAAQPLNTEYGRGQEGDEENAGERPRSSGQTVGVQPAQRSLDTATSSTSLLHSQRASASSRSADAEHAAAVAEVSQQRKPVQQDGPVPEPPQGRLRTGGDGSRLQVPRVRFNEATKLQLRSRAQRLATRGNFRSSKVKPGKLMKMDKMLVRIDITQQSLGHEFDERTSQGVETKSLDKWREFMVVCRKHNEGAVLQLYLTRVIASTADKTKKKPKAQILLAERGRTAKVSLFSTLDKTLCVWTWNRTRTDIYYLRPQSGAASVEWYTFLRGLLGDERARTLQINVPDLSVSLRLDDPFRTAELSKTLVEAAEGNDEALLKAISDEKGAAGAIVSRCVDMLKESPEWADVLKSWALSDHIGLAWKRYDRLEWVHGAVEQRMYGTIAMSRTHDLELRPKDHYPLSTKTKKGKLLEEPSPVEGFLIRLTSQKGQERRLGKMLFKRLYFTTQNHYLLFLQPSKASPPPPPKLPIQQNGNVPSTRELSDQVQLSYDIEPYPLDDDHQIAWLDPEGVRRASEQTLHDHEAAAEANRNMRMLLACDGFIDLRNVKKVRKFHKGAIPADEGIDSGSDVDFHEPVPERIGTEGGTSQLDEERVFELLLYNGLVIRLQAYNSTAKQEWISRLDQLVKYWRHRFRADMDLFKSVREQNLEALQIDERTEAQVGSFAYKWEVSQSYASSAMYNMCGIAGCRTIHMSGQLFRKPRRHTTFTRCHVILSGGHLLVFQDTLRNRTGQKLVHIHHERIASIDLTGCYLYSGVLTDNELLYQNRTFDSNMPGHHALPRIYLEDSWTSTDEDTMTTFVIWHAKSKSWFRSAHSVDDARSSERQNTRAERANTSESLREIGKETTKTKLSRVSKLGATGRSVVFKARSRAERDRWVLAIQTEIERLTATNEEVRLVLGEGEGDK